AAGFFSDINVIEGAVTNALTETPFGQFLTPGMGDGTQVEIIIRPQHLKLDFDRNGQGPSPTVTDGVPARGKVKRVRYLGHQSLVEFAMDYDGSILKVLVAGVFLPKAETTMWLSMRRDRCFWFVK
ncbi:MAG: TOBE domain-containing protein, partial [Amylibacter sp.]